MAVSPGAPAGFPRSAYWCRRSSGNTHAQAGLQLRGTRLGIGVPDSDGLLDDVAQELRNSVPSVWAQSIPCELVAWRACATQPPTALEAPAPTAGWAPMQPGCLVCGLATPQARVVLCCVVLCCVVLCCVVLCCVVLCCVVLCCVVLCCVVLCCVVLCCVVLCCSVLCCVVLCCVVLCCAVLCCAVLCCAVLCSAVPWCAEGAVTKRQKAGMSTHG